MNMSVPGKLFFQSLLFATFFVATDASAQPGTWIGGDGNWSDTANWFGTDVPNTATESASITNGSDVTLDSSFTIEGLTIGSDDSLEFLNSNDLSLNADVANDGVILLNGTGSATILLTNGAETTFAGLGEVLIGDQGVNTSVNVVGASSTGFDSTLTNTAGHTFRAIGLGSIGRGTTELINNGVFLADGAAANLRLNANASLGGLTNTGTIRAQGGGVLDLASVTNNTGGLIESLSSGSVNLASGSFVTGGDLTGDFTVTGASGIAGLSTSAAIGINNGQTLAADGAITNTGVIRLNGVGSAATLLTNSAQTTFSGSGEVLIGDTGVNTGANRFGASSAGLNSTVTNAAGHTFRAIGPGEIGRNTTELVNNGLFLADGATANLRLDARESLGGLTNTGTIRAQSDGVLELASVTNNTGGLIESLSGGSVNLATGSSVTGGNLAGDFTVTGTSAIANLSTSASIGVNNGQTLAANGAITNSGEIRLNGVGSAATLLTNSLQTTFTGSGEVLIGDQGVNTSANQIGASSSAFTSTVTNAAGHTFRAIGPGRIGRGTTEVVNNGLFLADGATANLLLNANASLGGLTNTGTIRAQSDGTVELASATNNTGGLIESLSGGSINLASGSAITGGNLAGDFTVTGASGIAGLTTSASIGVDNSRTLAADGAITNTGVIRLNGVGSAATLLTNSAQTTFTGSGEVLIGDQGVNTNANRIGASSSALIATLTNASGHTFRAIGPGNIGRSTTKVINDGLILANGATTDLRIATQNAVDRGLQNNGTIRAENGSQITITGPFVNGENNGTIEAIGTGSVVNASSRLLGGLGTLRAVDGQLLLGADGDANRVGATFEFFGTAFTDIFSNVNGSLGAGPSAPGDLRSDAFVENQGVFRIGDGLNFTSQVIGVDPKNTGTIIAEAGSTFSMGGIGLEGVICGSEGPCDPMGSTTVNAYFPLISTGTLAGSGTVKNTNTPVMPSADVPGDFINTDDLHSDGFIKPGDNPGETGTLTLRAHDIFLGDSNVIEIELGNGLSDTLSLVTDMNPVALNGDIEISLLNDFAPGVGLSFDIVTAADGLTGTFDAVTLPDLEDGFGLALNYTTNAVTVDVSLLGDFDLDGDVDEDDIDAYSGKIGLTTGSAGFDAALDLDKDGTIELADHDFHINNYVETTAGKGTLVGDINLDGDVDVTQIVFGPDGVQNVGDASLLLAGLGTTSGALWGDGDLNADGDVDVTQIVFGPGGVQNLGDASRLLANLGQSAASTPVGSSVPEPGCLALLAMAGIAGLIRRRKR